MAGKMRVVVFLTLLVISMAGAVQADTLFPLGLGYSANYAATWRGSYTATMQVTGTENVGGTQYWIMQFDNWDGGNVLGSMDMRATADTLYVSGTANPVFKTGIIGTTWTDHNGRETEIIGIAPLTVAAGTFADVYEICRSYLHLYAEQTFEYWKPGIGLLKEYDPVYQGYGPKNMEMTSYATPLPPSALLLGSGLLGLAVWRRRSKRS